MFLIPYKNSKEPPYIRNDCFENLFVLPYINSRLVFAELAIKAINEGEFDVVLLDLPFFLREKDWLDIAIGSFPFPSSLVIKTPMKEVRTINFVPNEAACIAIHFIHRLRERGVDVEYECIDDSNVINYPKEYFSNLTIKAADDYAVLVDGLGNYFSPTFEKLETAWADLDSVHKFFWDYRASIVASRLYNILKKGRKTLFLCNYRLWWHISEKLESGDFEIKKLMYLPWNDCKAALIYQDPQFLWIKGALDDYPAVVYQFFEKIFKGNFESFDKLKVLNKTIEDEIEKTNKKQRKGASIRTLKAFRRYLSTRLGVQRRMTPALTGDIYKTALYTIGKSFANDIAKRLLEYPVSEEQLVSFLSVKYNEVLWSEVKFDIPDEFQQMFLNSTHFATGDAGLIYNLNDSEQHRERLVAVTRPFIKKTEFESFSGKIGRRWAIRRDYLFHAKINKMIKQLAKKRSLTFRTKKSWGSIEDGIDWKATIKSKVIGENLIYVRKHLNSRANVLNINPFTPIVYILNEVQGGVTPFSIYDSNITQRNIDLGNEDALEDNSPAPDFVYSVFYLCTGIAYHCKRHIKREHISAILFLCTYSWMGLERYKNINERPARLQCRLDPNYDEELAPFSHSEKLVACGVKYAEDYVLVVGKDSWVPSSELNDFAKERGIRIIRESISCLSAEGVDRMSQLHTLSTPLKINAVRDSILERFIPDLFN